MPCSQSGAEHQLARRELHFAMNGQTGKFVGNLPVDKPLPASGRWGLRQPLVPSYAVAWLLWLAGFCKGGTEDEKDCYPAALLCAALAALVLLLALAVPAFAAENGFADLTTA